ncbi:hypothetical protein BDF20DRAFT_869951 [Mycotypha africana]|uniref:uncharacterized protein n=1 Tax=Mycotypha africana TaxID=64632 RepID=UPI002300ACCF|nr:uncharacterized protein BDF20DRAFT_869951 [Mycotypha africana]KAI8979499.1 hypothetical protein BDF20DRAFT_869951 [Mycotypha africana]
MVEQLTHFQKKRKVIIFPQMCFPTSADAVSLLSTISPLEGMFNLISRKPIHSLLIAIQSVITPVSQQIVQQYFSTVNQISYTFSFFFPPTFFLLLYFAYFYLKLIQKTVSYPAIESLAS